MDEQSKQSKLTEIVGAVVVNHAVFLPQATLCDHRFEVDVANQSDLQEHADHRALEVLVARCGR